MLFGNGGFDDLSGGDARDILFGGLGDDIIAGGAGNDRVFAGDGSDIVTGDAGRDRIDGGADRDAIFGGAGEDILLGGEARDFLFGGIGADVINGGTGNDRIFGGLGADNFAFTAGDGVDVIDDFNVAVDSVAFTGVFANFEELQAASRSAGGVSTRIDYGEGDFLVLRNVDIDALTADNFTFV